MSVSSFLSRSVAASIALAAAAALASPVKAQAPLSVVASFTILADLVEQIGGDRVAVTSLLGPGGDMHAFEPTPGNARALATADLLVVNGLGFEGWIDRLSEAAGYVGPVVVASDGILPLEGHEEEGHAGAEDDHGNFDPHAWQDVANVRVYVRNIAAALAVADPAGADAYATNLAAYETQLDAVDAEIAAAVAALPPDRRTVVTSHDAFGYFEAGYGLVFLAPTGVNPEAAPAAGDVAAIITQINENAIGAVFIETIADPRLMEQIARETGAVIGGRLYSDSLSPPDGPAPTYIDMMRYNLATLTAALGG